MVPTNFNRTAVRNYINIFVTERMIAKLKLQNFAASKTRNTFLPMTVLVGQNNAGKTTSSWGLRLLSIVTLRYHNLSFHPPPGDTDLPRRLIGVAPSLKNVEINFNTILTATAIHQEYWLHPLQMEHWSPYMSFRKVYSCSIHGKDGRIVDNRQQAAGIVLPDVRIMPQVALCKEENNSVGRLCSGNDVFPASTVTFQEPTKGQIWPIF